MSDENGAVWMPNANYFSNRDGHKPSYVVLHSTAGGTSAQAIANYFQSTQGTDNPVSSHYIVGTDGTVVQCVNESDGAWANGFVSGVSGISGNGIGNGYHDVWWDSGINPNLLTISIEHVKSATDNSNALTPAQQQASFKLIRDICQRHNIPMRKADATGGVTFHGAIDPVNRPNCPGIYTWTALWQYLAGATNVTTLEGFPMKSQLDQDVNAQFDCAPASIAAALQWLTGQSFSGAQVKDAVYGTTYTGNTDPANFVAYCAERGVLLSSINAPDAALVDATKQQLTQSHPVLLTEIDPYMPASSGETHVVVAYACDADSITVMDPYIDAQVTKTDQQWQNDLRSNQIWSMEKSMIPAGWKDSGATLTAPNGITVTLGFREYVINHQWDSNNWPLEEAHGQNPLELSNPSIGSGTQQTFRWAVLEWTPTQGVFVAWSGQELLKMRALLAQNQPTTPVVTINTQQALSTIQAVLSALQPTIPALQSVVKDLEPS